MSEVFSLQHYFVVFHPGSGGNFLSGLISKLLSNNLEQLEIASTGSSHTTVSTKNTIYDLSCGTFVDDQPEFNSFEDRVEYYRSRFTDSPVTTPQVSWTHDFTNIPVYRALFPKAKILVVTQDSAHEKLAVTILQQLKNILDPNVNSAVSVEKKEQYLTRWKAHSLTQIESMIGDRAHAEEIVNDRFNQQHKDIITYVTLIRMFGYYKLMKFIDPSKYFETDVVNYVLKPTVGQDKPYTVIGSYAEFIDNRCIKIPYTTIISQDVDEFTKIFTRLFGQLTVEQQGFLEYTFEKYYNSQNLEVLSDPLQYFMNSRKNALTYANTLKEKHT